MERALLEVIGGKDPCGFRKLAFYVHSRNCGRSKHIFTWEDLLYETFTRFILAIKRGVEPRKKDCRPLLFQIAKHVCWEWGRKESSPLPEPEKPKEDPVAETPEKSRSTPNFPIEDLAVLMKMVPELREAVEQCMTTMSRKCRLLLSWRYFQEDPVTDPSKLATMLAAEGFQVSPHVIPQELANCKARLRKCLVEKLRD